ncbi:hemerythrin family protein [Azospirillum sp. RWY-5-1]|uniref:Hemerythrin family protein n=1 Tax=Azospirillum oleiclasticum TaxID=2735135 RepID=A0ABX2TM87_9PROT|nr:hemerythrin family protein [Azospirillum oleiclasticum]NYZ16810.1 hemerythrin family protein [Azospirillum oleiclasticum]NYZ24457.1 hemerythrin family protein [Azospirillum oleiclasticum]
MRHLVMDWGESFDVGDPVIDHEHRMLLDLFRSLAEPEAPTDTATLRARLDELVALACQHFDHEDALMRRLHYPGIREHQEEHDALLEQLNKYIALLDEAPDPPPVSGIVEFVGLWVLDHIDREDRKLSAFLAGTIGLAVPA